MASSTDIVNVALTLLGSPSITSLDVDETKGAVEAKKIYNVARDAVLGSQNWSFAIVRARLPAMAEAPLYGFGQQFQLPVDCLRIVMVGDFYVGVDLSDFRGAPIEQFAIEGRKILTDLGAPLSLRYVKRVEDTTLFHPTFAMMFAGELAEQLVETLTQSDSKRDRAIAFKRYWLGRATQANAVEIPAQKLPDDEWLFSRL